jgi:hypothetical protein
VENAGFIEEIAYQSVETTAEILAESALSKLPITLFISRYGRFTATSASMGRRDARIG